MKRILSRGLAPGISVASQLVGIIQLLLLLLRVGANDATDAYIYLFNMGMLPTQILTVGVVFPMLLNTDRLTRRAAAWAKYVVPLLSMISVVLASTWIWSNGRLGTQLIPIVCASALNAYFQACVWSRAIGAEAGGDATWISGIAIPANVLAVIALCLPLSGIQLVTAMVTGLTVGNAALLVAMRARRVGDASIRDLPDARPPRSRAELWFLTKSIVGYGGLAAIQSLAVLLPPSTLTFLAVAAKLVAAIVATFVNAVLPRFVHQRSDELQPAMRFLVWLYVGTAGIGAAVIVGTWASYPAMMLSGVTVALWLVGAVANAVAQRAAFRFLPPSASRATLIVLPAIALLSVASSLSPNFSVGTLLCAYAVIDAATASLLLLALRQQRLAFVSMVVVALIASLWIYELV